MRESRSKITNKQEYCNNICIYEQSPLAGSFHHLLSEILLLSLLKHVVWMNISFIWSTVSLQFIASNTPSNFVSNFEKKSNFFSARPFNPDLSIADKQNDLVTSLGLN